MTGATVLSIMATTTVDIPQTVKDQLRKSVASNIQFNESHRNVPQNTDSDSESPKEPAL